MRAEPDEAEAFLKYAEALIYLERPREALNVFQKLLQTKPMHPMAHIGAAQSKSLLGGDPFPHLDAAIEINRAATIAVLKKTYDFRTLAPSEFETVYSLEELTRLLNVSSAEIKIFAENHNLPIASDNGSILESELSRWVGVQNRYNLLPFGLHWSAPTPRRLPDIY
jgi:hypothetical protein